MRRTWTVGWLTIAMTSWCYGLFRVAGTSLFGMCRMARLGRLGTVSQLAHDAATSVPREQAAGEAGLLGSAPDRHCAIGQGPRSSRMAMDSREGHPRHFM